MTTEELKALEISKSVDARSTACPGPLLEAKKAVADCAIEGILEILTSDDGTIMDIQRWSKKMKHEYVGDWEDDGYWHIYMKRKK
jgi:TusA-related sulfurtransferase